MAAKTRRLQLLVEDDQFRRLEAAARERQVSVATVVREALDAALPLSAAQRREAGDRILAAAPMPVGDPDELRDELAQLRGRRG